MGRNLRMYFLMIVIVNVVVDVLKYVMMIEWRIYIVVGKIYVVVIIGKFFFGVM